LPLLASARLTHVGCVDRPECLGNGGANAVSVDFMDFPRHQPMYAFDDSRASTTPHGIAGAAPETRFNFDDPSFTHLYAEAGRLAQADRRQYLGDPGFVKVLTAALTAGPYLQARSRLINPDMSTPMVQPGTIDVAVAHAEPPQASESADATSQLAVVDGDGNALSLTTTNNLNFGSRLMVDGYVLNNAMTNFTGVPRPGQAAPNRMQAGKRPVSGMAPVIVFDAAGSPVLVGGSAQSAVHVARPPWRCGTCPSTGQRYHARADGTGGRCRWQR
jgi:hypothetical protein